MSSCKHLNKLREIFEDDEAYWLCAYIARVSRVWVELLEGHEVSAERVNRVFWLLWFDIPANPVYRQLYGQLQPMIAILNVQLMESARYSREYALVVRKNTYHLITQIIYLRKGYNAMRKVAKMVTEDLILEELDEDLSKDSL